MHLVGLVDSPDHVCCRYRLAALRPALAAAGHTLALHAFPRFFAGRLALARSLRPTDTAVVQRKLLPWWQLALLRRRVSRLVFDFDDAVWLRDSYSPKGFTDPRRARRFRRACAAADLIVAGNDYLAAEARRHAPAARVVVVPTCVDVTKYPLVPKPPRPGVQLVWVGSSSTLHGLERFTPTLSAIGRAVPGTRLKLICDRFITIPDLPVDNCVWSEATEAAELAAADVGIGWVPNDPWSRGKCGLKVLQYQAAGLPVVANPVGVQADFVRNGATGFQATTPDEWVAAVRALTDPALRTTLGAAGRRQVEATYSVPAAAAAWVAALERLAPAKAA